MDLVLRVEDVDICHLVMPFLIAPEASCIEFHE